MRKIVIICQGRTGSTNLSDFYKKKYKIKNLGEIFRNKDYVNDPDSLIQELANKKNWIVKLIPIQVLNAAFASFLKKKYPVTSFNNKMRIFQHIENFRSSLTNYNYYLEHKQEIFQEAIDICLKIINLSDHHCYLYRKDFVGQIQSLVGAAMSHEYGPNRTKEKVYVPEELITSYRDSIIKTYELIKEIYIRSPNDIISTESLTVGKKYNPVTVKSNSVSLDDYDVGKEIFGI
jgi:hypothetical protein